MWILAAKLPNSDLKFVVDFWVDFSSCFLPRKKARKHPQKIPREIHLGLCSEKFPSHFCRSLFLRFFVGPKKSRKIPAKFPSPKIRDAETTILIKFAFRRGSGRGNIYGKLSKTLFFLGNSMTIKFGKFANFIVRNFVVIWEAPKKKAKFIDELLQGRREQQSGGWYVCTCLEEEGTLPQERHPGLLDSQALASQHIVV